MLGQHKTPSLIKCFFVLGNAQTIKTSCPKLSKPYFKVLMEEDYEFLLKVKYGKEVNVESLSKMNWRFIYRLK